MRDESVACSHGINQHAGLLQLFLVTHFVAIARKREVCPSRVLRNTPASVPGREKDGAGGRGIGVPDARVGKTIAARGRSKWRHNNGGGAGMWWTPAGRAGGLR